MSVMKPETQEAFDQYKELSSSRALSEVLAEFRDEFEGNGGMAIEAAEQVLSKYFA